MQILFNILATALLLGVLAYAILRYRDQRDTKKRATDFADMIMKGTTPGEVFKLLGKASEVAGVTVIPVRRDAIPTGVPIGNHMPIPKLVHFIDGPNGCTLDIRDDGIEDSIAALMAGPNAGKRKEYMVHSLRAVSPEEHAEMFARAAKALAEQPPSATHEQQAEAAVLAALVIPNENQEGNAVLEALSRIKERKA